MSKDLRAEFEEFISTLTTQICKDVMLEDLKTIHNSFSDLSIDYKNINQNYTKNINGISNEFMELRRTNTSLNTVTSSIDTNSNLINKSLETLEGKHRIIIDSIMNDTKQQFNEYNLKIQKLNEEERIKFQRMMATTINQEFNKSIVAFNSKLDNFKVDDILIKQNAVHDSIYRMTSLYSDTQEDMQKMYTKTNREIEQRMTAIEHNIKTINEKTYKAFSQTRIMILGIFLIFAFITYVLVT